MLSLNQSSPNNIQRHMFHNSSTILINVFTFLQSALGTFRVPNAALWVTLHRDKVHGEEAAHITPPHKSFCNIHNILQDLRRNVHNPVCPVSYRNHLIPVLCN